MKYMYVCILISCWQHLFSYDFLVSRFEDILNVCNRMEYSIPFFFFYACLVQCNVSLFER